MKQICPTCQGKKSYHGMGYMIIKCKRCKATGVVDKEDEVKVMDEDKVGEIVEKKSSKKSKKGIIDEQTSKSSENEQNL